MSEDQAVSHDDRLKLVSEGEFAGWSMWQSDAFEQRAGPFYEKFDADGRGRCAFRAEPRHMNGGGFMHGGCLMTFADYALFCIAKDYLGGGKAVTVTMNSEFLRSANVGDFMEATGEVVKGGRALIFVRGVVTASGRSVLTFSATLMKVTA